ncbi:MAG: translation initiation factor [Sphingobacteriales bacterium]|nr:MAG: translation initiation factor [Sphingobacteriales bacterium]
MSQQKKSGLSSLSGLVFSTNPEAMKEVPQAEMVTAGAKEQKLRVILDRKQRGGKVVTLVEGFLGNEEDLQALGKKIKTKCGTGGSAKEGIILIQGDYKQKITAWLIEWGYSKTKAV